VKSKIGGLLLALAMSLALAPSAHTRGAKPDFAMVITALTTAATAGVWEWFKAHFPGGQTVADKATEPVQWPSPWRKSFDQGDTCATVKLLVVSGSAAPPAPPTQRRRCRPRRSL
jgi:hypothetical protein